MSAYARDRDESFDATVRALFSAQHRGAALASAAAARKQTVPQMEVYFRRLVNYAHDRVAAAHFMNYWSKLPCVHVTGTKGKGSTCAFIEGILSQIQVPEDGDRKDSNGRRLITGTFTSPHLVRVTERFRVGQQPVRDAVFIECFWEVWDALHAAAAAESAATGSKSEMQAVDTIPGYFRLVTIVAFWIFAKECVDVAIIEVGCGGRYDATNILGATITSDGQPTWKLGQLLATGVTTLDLDHTQTLGSTFAEIANEKGGIYKPGVPALTVPQVEEAMVVLRQCAASAQSSLLHASPPSTSTSASTTCDIAVPVHLMIIPPIKDLNLHLVSEKESAASPSLPGLLVPSFQRTNAALAIALSCLVHRALGLTKVEQGSYILNNFITSIMSEPDEDLNVATIDVDAILQSNKTVSYTSSSFLIRGLVSTTWPGRCQSFLAVPLENFLPNNCKKDLYSLPKSCSLSPVRWHIDCAHTPKSMHYCRKWFESTMMNNRAHTNVASTQTRERILIFNCSHEKDVLSLIETLAREEDPAQPTFHYAVFCPASASRPSRHQQPSVAELLSDRPHMLKDLSNSVLDVIPTSSDGISSENNTKKEEMVLAWQKTLAKLWRCLRHEDLSQSRNNVPTVAVAMDLKSAMQWVCTTVLASLDDGASIDVLITGSIYLIGGALSIISPGGDGVAPGHYPK